MAESIPSDSSGADTPAPMGAEGRHQNRELARTVADLEAQLRHATEALETALRESRTDPITQLRNRRAFEEDLAQQLSLRERYGTPFSLLMLDIDHFKSINDEYGHPGGDELLRQFAALVSRTHRRSDCAARYGGDEFTLLLPQTPEEGAVAIAQRLRQTVEAEPFRIERIELRIRVSAGVAEARSGDTAEELVSRADRALYGAKASGRNRVCRAG